MGRLIGSSRAPEADVAVGEVTSQRLQWMPPVPPPIYDAVYPIAPLAAPLTYRRTAILVRSASPSTLSRDYIVLVDAHNASALPDDAPLLRYLAFTFFQQDGEIVNQTGASAYDLGNATLYSFAGSLDSGPLSPLTTLIDRWNWTSEGNENATRLRLFPPHGPPSSAGGDYFVSVIYPGGSTAFVTPGESGPAGCCVPTPSVSLSSSGMAGFVELRVTLPDSSEDLLHFSGASLNASMEPDGSDGSAIVTLTRGNAVIPLLIPSCINVAGHSQGSVGLTVLDVGYPFGEVPAWLMEKRAPGGIDQPRPYLWPLNPAMPETG